MKKTFLIFIISISIFTLSACNRLKPFTPEEINAEHQFYDEDFYNYIRYVNFPYIKNNTTKFKQSLTTYMGIKNGTGRSIDSYQFDYTHSRLETFFNLEPTMLNGGIARKFSHEFLPEHSFESKIKNISGKIIYSHIVNDIKETKTYLFAESFFDTDIIDPSFSENELDGSLVFTFNNNTINTESYYRFKINAIVSKTNRPYHLDFQTYIKTTSNEIYPFMGIYNYNVIDEDYISISDLKVDKQIDIDSILIYAEYNDGENIEIIKYIIPQVLG